MKVQNVKLLCRTCKYVGDEANLENSIEQLATFYDYTFIYKLSEKHLKACFVFLYFFELADDF